MKRIALIDLKYNTVELFYNMGEVMDFIYKLDNNIENLCDYMFISEEKILDVLKDKEKITITNYYDEDSKDVYDFSYDEWKEFEKINNKRMV